MNNIRSDVASWMNKCVGKYKIEAHLHSDRADVYKILGSSAAYYLKVAENLASEYDATRLLHKYVVTPKIVDVLHQNDKDYLLMTELPGKSLAMYKNEWSNEVIVKQFAKAVRQFHSLDTSTFAKHANKNTVVLHGDMSLPNIIAMSPDTVGFIDLGRVRVGLADEDLADALWSIQRNIGPGYGELFLGEYGNVVMTPKLKQALAFRYAS